MGQKPKNKSYEIELSVLNHLIRPDELIILVWSDVKIGYEMTELCPFKAGAKVASWPISGRKLAFLATVFEILTLNLFCP